MEKIINTLLVGYNDHKFKPMPPKANAYIKKL